MTTISSFTLRLCTAGILGFATPGFADWHQDWGGWSFDFDVYGMAGLELHNVKRNNELVINKASFPVMRVDYSPGKCNESPFSDLLHWHNLLPWRAGDTDGVGSSHHDPGYGAVDFGNLSVTGSWCGDKICIRSYTAGADGHSWLELGVTGHEGNYVIYQAWYLSDHGHIMARVYSKGQQCPNHTHRHHPYWRIDFDIVQPENNSVFVYNDGLPYMGSPPDKGWGPGMDLYFVETDALKDSVTNTMWLVQDDNTGHGAWVIPGHVNGRDDGEADVFSNRDVSVRLFHPNEEGPWTDHVQGQLELGYRDGEAIKSANVVFWYIAHFEHQEPLSPYIQTAPCGDPGFAAIFKAGTDCNDVFGVGPIITIIQGPGDQSPIPSFDFGLKILPDRDNCGVGGMVPGGTEGFQAVINGIPAGDKPTFAWAVSGSGAAPVGSSDKDHFEIQLGNDFGEVDVTVTASVSISTTLGSPQVTSRTATFAYFPDTLQSTLMKGLHCLVKSQEKVNLFVKPLWDPLRDLVTHPYSPEELQQIQGLAQETMRSEESPQTRDRAGKILQYTNKLLSFREAGQPQ